MKATTNPCTIIEVLSESTEAKDRGEKWQGYRTIPSLQEYVLIAQDQVYVEIFRKIEEEDKEALWLNEYHNDLAQSVTIATQSIQMAEIYRDVEFEKEE
ncbi:MAG: Uma2 family endonuclease [Bacteroidota bacterium]